MSSFLTTNENRARIAAYLWTNREEMPDKYRITDKFSCVEELYEFLTMMNLEALRERYGIDEVLENAECVDLFPNLDVDAPIGTIMMSMKCFRYQCSEGRIFDLPEYQKLDAFVDARTAILTPEEREKMTFFDWQ